MGVKKMERNKYKEAFITIKKVLALCAFEEYRLETDKPLDVKNFYRQLESDENIKLLQELVDRATPMKPKLNEETGLYICRCGLQVGQYHHLPFIKRNYAHCWHCGQKLDWSK